MSEFLRELSSRSPSSWPCAVAPASAFARPRQPPAAAAGPRAQKLIAYESGVDPVGDGWSQSQIRYYVFALLFVLFDVEAVFIFPWAIQLEAYGGFGLVEMGVFVVRPASSASSTPGARESCDGCEPLMGLVEKGRMPKPLTNLLNTQPQVLAVGVPVGPGLLRHRDGRRLRLAPLRRDAPRRHPASRPAPARPTSSSSPARSPTRWRPAIAPALRADARPEVRDLDGLVRQLRRPLLGQLLGHQGRRPDHPGRRLRARLPAPARGAARGHRAAAGAHPQRGHGRALERRALRADRGRRARAAEAGKAEREAAKRGEPVVVS